MARGFPPRATSCVLIKIMTDSELRHAREQKWHLDGHTVRTLDEASFVPRVGGFLPDVSPAASGPGADFRGRMGRGDSGCRLRSGVFPIHVPRTLLEQVACIARQSSL